MNRRGFVAKALAGIGLGGFWAVANADEAQGVEGAAARHIPTGSNAPIATFDAANDYVTMSVSHSFVESYPGGVWRALRVVIDQMREQVPEHWKGSPWWPVALAATIPQTWYTWLLDDARKWHPAQPPSELYWEPRCQSVRLLRQRGIAQDDGDVFDIRLGYIPFLDN